ncbi:MAG: glutathione S-transferase [Alphaproteobacteria bacterium]|nr:glutathione S-transferase [Alphaproteobacteria bacterium]
MELIIGDKVWSSWSMRPWLVMRRTGAPFVETLVHLREHEATTANIRAAGSPTGLVPVLRDGDLTVWDSLAISEYLADRFPKARLWPADPAARALTRAAAAEMHSGFPNLRRQLSMDLARRAPVDLEPATKAEIARVVELWRLLLGRFSGPYLGGAWSIADAFYTPVATRFRSYQVDLAAFGDDGAAAAYAARLLAEPEFLDWERDALK